MGLNIYELFGTSEETAKAGMKDALKAGASGALGWLEQQAINVLNKDKAQHEANVQAYTKDILDKPSNPNSFGSYLSNLMANPALQTYGPYLMAGVAVIAVIAISLKGK